jgi:hypothetical protein
VNRAAAVRLSAACTTLILACPLPTASLDIGLTARAAAEAFRVGRSGQAARDRFHAAYRTQVDDPVVVELDLVTEFRAVVLLTEERARLGDTSWTEERAAAAAGARRGRLELTATLRFNPRNTYRAVPGYSVAIYQRNAPRPLLPIDSRTTPAYVAGQPAPPGTPILGATLVATFDASRLDPASRCLAAILLDGREVRRVPLDLAAVR